MAGLRNRRVWDLQPRDDRNEPVESIPIPPKYNSADFLKAEHWKLRGELDVPKERWDSSLNCESDTDATFPVAWA